MATRFLLLTGILSLALGTTGCIQDNGTRFNPFHPGASIDADQERELGFRFDHDVQDHLPFIDDLEVLAFVDDLGQWLVHGIEPQPFLYRFRVIQDPTLNAFAVPGGYVYLHSGTILAVASVEELAGVLAHEIAHVKARHFVRLQERSAIPDLLTGLAAIVAGVATKDPAATVAVQAANQALKLRFTREFEAEADRLGATFMVRAGYDPRGMVRFFERLVLEKKLHPQQLPPYLYSHPQVEERVTTISRLAETMQALRRPPPALEERLAGTQARLDLLIGEGRSRRVLTAPFDRDVSAPHLARARERAERGDRAGALQALEEAQRLEPKDPRIPFRRAHLLEEDGRLAEAIAAYHTTLELDPSRALVFHKLGLLYKRVGRRAPAAFFFEQAVRRAAPDGELRERAEWELEKAIFPILEDAGLGETLPPSATDVTGATQKTAFGPGDSRAVWWGRLGPHFVPHLARLRIRWVDPLGEIAQENEPDRHQRVLVSSELSLRELNAAQTGLWSVEARLDDDIVDRRSFRISR